MLQMESLRHFFYVIRNTVITRSLFHILISEAKGQRSRDQGHITLVRRYMTEKEQVLKLFPRELRMVLEQMELDFELVQELRLRVGQPFLAVGAGCEYMIGARGEIGDTGSFSPLLISREQMRETVEYMGSFSLYALEEELRQGFFTVQGGHRIGVAGRTVAQGSTVRLMKHISFLNVRVARQKKGCADDIMESLYSQEGRFLNTLILSPPRCGKTTLLRDIIRQVSNGYYSSLRQCRLGGMTVGVVDERSELGACFEGVPQNDLGMRTDVLDCCPKSQGMMMLVRTMAPAVVAVDEIGSREETEAVEYALNCGCSLAATIHAGSLEEAMGKTDAGRLLKKGAFQRIVLLKGNGQAGQIQDIFDGDGKRVSWGGIKWKGQS